MKGKMMKTYRMLCDGEQEWVGKASNLEHAEERCFWDEPPAESFRYTLQVWNGKAWKTLYKDARLTI